MNTRSVPAADLRGGGTPPSPVKTSKIKGIIVTVNFLSVSV